MRASIECISRDSRVVLEPRFWSRSNSRRSMTQKSLLRLPSVLRRSPPLSCLTRKGMSFGSWRYLQDSRFSMTCASLSIVGMGQLLRSGGQRFGLPGKGRLGGGERRAAEDEVAGAVGDRQHAGIDVARDE